MENYKEIDFKQIELGENDKYTSISDVITTIKEPFDQIGAATNTRNKHFNNPESEYYHLSIEQICEKWEEKGATSRKYGCMLDDYIGYNLNEDEIGLEEFELDYDKEGDERLNRLCTSFDNFVNDILKQHPELKYVDRERTLYYKVPGYDNFYIKGRLDALFYNAEKDRYLIIDWKSSAAIAKKPDKWTKNLKGPCKELYDMDWYTYTIQVYFYKTALEANYLNGKEADCIIVQLPGAIVPDSGKDYCIHTPAFKYSKEFMDKLFVYIKKKKDLAEKKNEIN